MITKEFFATDQDKGTTYVSQREFSPIFFILNSAEISNPTFLIENLRRGNTQIKQFPYLGVKGERGYWQMPFTAALLMESYAVLAEMNILHHAFPGKLSLFDIFSLVSSGPEYLGPIIYAIDNGPLTGPLSFMTIAILIDLSLMYDLYVLFNVSPIDDSTGKGIIDHYPANVYLSAVHSLKELPALKSIEDVPRFYNQLCRYLKLPSPEFMANQTFAVADKLHKKCSENTFLHLAVKTHRDALKFRMEDPLNFPVNLLGSSENDRFFALAKDSATFYSIRTKEPFSFFQDRLDLLTLHSILYDAMVTDSIDCPLKKGNPFFCDKRYLKDAGGNCFFLVSTSETLPKYECPFEKIARTLHLRKHN